jgi:glycosyltransferase involved in cell wall biosynthesis
MLPLDRPDDFNFMKRTLLRGPYLASLAQADLLICVSAATLERTATYVPTARERAVVVPLAASSSLVAAKAETVGRLASREFALVVGDPSPRKNLELIVDLWPNVVARRPGAVLAIAGPRSWGPSSYGRLHEQLVEQGHVVPLGHVSDAELRWCYEHATVALCPSLLEGFGLPAIEALTYGAPLITSEDAALCEVSGPDALHLPATDHLAWEDAIVSAFMAGRPPTSSTALRPRTWEDVAAETVAAVRRGL